MDSFDKEVKDVSVLQAQRVRHRQHTLNEAATGGTAAAERDLPPQHPAAEHPLGVVIGRLDAVSDNETPKSWLQVHQVAAKVRRLGIGAIFPRVEHLTQVSRHRAESVLQLAARQPSPAEKVPRFEDLADGLQAFGADDRGRTATIQAFLEVALKMGPANLPQEQRPASIDTPAVGAKNTVDSIAQQGDQTQQAARALNDEGRDGGGRSHPQPTPLAGF